MEKKPKLEFKCCYSTCENYYPDKNILFVQFPETCLQFQQNCVNGSIDQHIIHCKDCEKASKWVEACGRGLVKSIYDVTKNLFICGKHFVGGKGPTEKHPYPVPITGGDIKIKSEEIDTNFIKEEKIEIEEHPLKEIKEEKLDCDWIKQEDMTGLKKEHDQPQCSKQNTNKPCVSTQTKLEEDSMDEEGSEDPIDEGSLEYHMHEESSEDQMDEEDSEELTDSSEFETEDSSEDEPRPNMSQAEYQELSMKQNKKECYYFTGLHYNQICNLLKFLGARPKIADTNLTPIQQLIIVLMRLRRGTEICDLAIRNNTTSKFIIQLVKTWVLFMRSQFAKKFKEKMPKKVDFKKLKGFQFLKNVDPLNNGGSMAPFVLVCACLLMFQSSNKQ